MDFVLGSLLAALAMGTAGFLGVERFAQSGFVRLGIPEIALGVGGYDAEDFVGIAIATLALPLAIQLFYTASWKSRAAFQGNLALPLHLALSACCLAFAWLMYDRWRAGNLLRCGFFFCAFYGSVKNRGKDTANGYYQVISLPLCILALAFACAHLWFALSKPKLSTSTDATRPLLPPPARASRTKRFPVLSSLAVVAFVLAMAFLSSILLPGSWLNYTARKIRINAIEIVDAESAFKDFKFGLVTRPEIPDAIFRTIEIELPRKVKGKIFPDVYLFYGYLILSLAWFALTKKTLALRKPVFAVLTLTFLFCYVHAWWYHNWVGWFGGLGNFVHQEPGTFEALARTMGQVSSLLLGLLLLPVSRNSSLMHLAQVSHQEALPVHRALANAFLLVTVLHMAFWYKVFAEKSIFPHDALSGIFVAPPSFFPLNYHAQPHSCDHATGAAAAACRLDPLYGKPAADNFTMPLMNLVFFYVALPAFGVLTFAQVRRKHYEWFYYAHCFAAFVLVITVVWHASCILVFLFPGAVFISIDLAQRFKQNAEEVKILQVVRDKDGTGITALQLECRRAIAPGQYIMLHLPAISHLAFHPFSVSSIADDKEEHGALWVHIQATGSSEDSFSRLVHRAPESALQYAHVQGPFGSPPNFLRGSNVPLVFVAGGIGITPIACIVEHLLLRSPSSTDDAVHGEIVVLWTARRGRALFRRFAKWLALCHAAPRCQIKLFSTGDGDQGSNAMMVGEEETGIVVTSGRANIQQELAPYLLHCDNILVYACGPNALMEQTRAACAPHAVSCEFVSEEFEF